MTFCLSPEEVIEINRRIGCGGHLVSRSGLESALARPLQSMFGQDAYPTLVEKASVLIHGVASNHCFMDGNKRTSWICANVFLALQNQRLRTVSDKESGQFVLDVLKGTLSLKEGAAWLLERLE